SRRDSGSARTRSKRLAATSPEQRDPAQPPDKEIQGERFRNGCRRREIVGDRHGTGPTTVERAVERGIVRETGIRRIVGGDSRSEGAQEPGRQVKRGSRACPDERRDLSLGRQGYRRRSKVAGRGKTLCYGIAIVARDAARDIQALGGYRRGRERQVRSDSD